MARKLLCGKCDNELSELANKYSEHFESIKGISNGNYLCDSCGKELKEGETVYAACLLPNIIHPNYRFQKPEYWMEDYFKKILN